jgi:pimeloyl-ACP methyl ester carboxylesterase
MRLRLPFITSGHRYKALDGQRPEWSAVYDVSDLSQLEKRIYTRLREERSKREKAVMGTFDTLDRKIYSTVSVRGDIRGPAPVLVAASMRLPESHLEEFDRWYEQEHVGMVSKIPGWLRTRRFKMLVGGVDGMPPAGQVECLAVHDFEHADGLKGPEMQAALSTPWREEVKSKVTWSSMRVWGYHLTFDTLEEPTGSVLTTDGAELRFQLEGNPADPVVVCVNSIMTTLHIWDDVARALLNGVNGKTYRVLRYNARGYSQQAERSNDTTFDLLADDLEYLLQRLDIEKVHAVVGVSMGGVTAINFAIRRPQMLEKFIACDCNVSSSPANSQAWADRVALAKSKGMAELADVTVKRWFIPEHHDSANVKKVLPMVANAHVEGFQQNANALSNFDLKPYLANIKTPGLLIAGEGDGKIPEAMQKFGIPGTTFQSIPNAGHLPFLENHDDFMAALAGFL